MISVTDLSWILEIDVAFVILSEAIVWLGIGLLMVWQWKPKKNVILSALASGIIIALYDLLFEGYTAAIGFWGYISDYMFLGVPVTVPIYFTISGFGAGVLYNKVSEYLKSKREIKHMNLILPLLFIIILSLISTLGDIIGARPEFAWGPENWSYFYTYLLWVSIWLLCLASFHLLRRRFIRPKAL